jgi:hypothetical protein
MALAVSAALGLVGGVAGATIVDGPPQPDPLGLGIPLVDQQCTGKSVLVTAWGTATNGLSPAVAEDPGHTRYLDVTRSCRAAWKQRGTRSHGYVTYLGPYASVGNACEVRMTAVHHGDRVVELNAQATEPVQCLCHLDFAQMPELRPGMEADVRESIYIYALQDLLGAMGLISPDHLTGVYDEQTVAAVRSFEGDRSTHNRPGIVDSTTWQSLVAQCHLYD